MNEILKRLAPTQKVLRELYLKSGNLCAFEGCSALLMDADGVFIAQICHIEAAVKGGQRFNDNSTIEARRQVNNLMLMCHAHHKVTDDVAKYPVEKLRQMKAAHEARFSNPARAMLKSIKDWTTAVTPSRPQNLDEFNRILKLNWSKDDCNSAIVDLNQLIEKLKGTPTDIRTFLSRLVDRAHRLGKSECVKRSNGNLVFSAKDIESAFQLSDKVVADLAVRLEQYGVGSLSADSFDGFADESAISLNVNGWDGFWTDLAIFCEKTGENLDLFVLDLDFARLDQKPPHSNRNEAPGE